MQDMVAGNMNDSHTRAWGDGDLWITRGKIWMHP